MMFSGAPPEQAGNTAIGTKKESVTTTAIPTQKREALKCIYNSLENDVPIIVGVSGAGCDHVVTAVGVLSNADYDNLSLSDILIVDPYGGEVTSLEKYTGIDTGWGLRVPIE